MAGCLVGIVGEACAATDEIVVTARKREERLVDVPIAASIVTGDELTARGGLILDLGDVIQGIPGARYNNLTDGSLSEVNLRGSGAARGTNAEVAVGLFRDGVYAAGGFQFARNTMRIDNFDLERVEVLRGTQGALFGRNAVGGAINLISARPQFEESGRASVDYAWDIKRTTTELVWNYPLSENWAMRFSFNYLNQDDGFVQSISTGEQLDAGDGVMARAQLRYRNDNGLDIVALLERQEQDHGSVYANRKFAPGVSGYPVGFVSPRYDLTWDKAPTKDVANLNNFTLTVNYEMEWATLTSVSAWRDRHITDWIDLDLMSVEGIALAQALGNTATYNPVTNMTVRHLTDDTQTLYQEAHLAGDIGTRTNWLLGFEILDQHGFYYVNDSRPDRDNRRDVDFDYFSIAPYGLIGFDITDRLNFTGEVRYTHDNKRAAQFAWLTNSGPRPAQPTFLATLEANNVSFNTSLSYDLTASSIVYAKFGTGYRSGGFNPTLGSPAAPNPVVPAYGNERSTTYEVGAKGNITDDLFVGLAAYMTHVANAITRTNNGCFAGSPICNETATNFAINAGRANLWGVELEGAYQFTLLGGDGTLRASGSRQEGEYAGGALDGFEVPQNPDWIAGATLSYKRPFFFQTEAFGNLVYAGSWGGVQETEGVPEIDSRNLLDARLGVRYGGWEASLYAKNLTNTTFRYLSTTSSDRWSFPRVLGATVRYKW
ncbi:MAG: TonB-dependent receptor [Alphaproteobacteria bacterium]|nr:TonB-dependent receptor [Alphaproteobacteria bacterium]